MTTPTLATIPVTSICAGGLLDYTIAAGVRARALRDTCVAWMPAPSRMMLPVIDALTRKWLLRSHSPYLAEVAAIAGAIDVPGIWFLNGCYQWGCTAFAREQDGAPWLARTLDWPFPGLGRHIEIARMRGKAGGFDNVTWPGYVGTLTASAPGRFAASINQAPMYRRTKRPWLRPYDLAANLLKTWRIDFIPPDHLLREVFETCQSFAEARARLEITPIARPVIYTLVGTNRGERCVIERTEIGFSSRDDNTAAANDWIHSALPWEARVPSDLGLTRTSEEARANSRTRREQVANWSGRFGNFGWVTEPVLNRFTRIAVELCPARGVLRLVGYEKVEGNALPVPVTLPCELMPLAAA